MFIPVWLVVVVPILIFLLGVFCGGCIILYQQRLEKAEKERCEREDNAVSCPHCCARVVILTDDFCVMCGKPVKAAPA